MKVILLLAVVGLGIYVARSFLGPYHGLVPVTLPGGARYEVLKGPDDCQAVPGTCMARFVFVTATMDTTTLRKEAEGLLPWVETQGMGTGIKLVALIGVKPGFARLGKPRFLAALGFAWRDGRWIYGGTKILPPDLGLAGQ